MKKNLLLILAILIPFSAQSNPIDDKCGQFAPYGAPVTTTQVQYLCKTNYAIAHNNATKTPQYVLEHITKEAITGPTKRKDSFRPDPAVDPKYQAQLADYATAGNIYDRGHLSPAGDNTQTEQIMSESFFLSNMIPQVANNNRGIWKQLEVSVRNYVLATNDVYVVSGTIYNNVYKTIGLNSVGVPDKIFKVIIDAKNNKASAYVFPNTALPVGDLPKFKVSIKDVEAQTGINFNPKLAPNSTLETSKTW